MVAPKVRSRSVVFVIFESCSVINCIFKQERRKAGNTTGNLCITRISVNKCFFTEKFYEVGFYFILLQMFYISLFRQHVKI